MKRENLHRIVAISSFPIMIINMMLGIIESNLIYVLSGFFVFVLILTLSDTKMQHYKPDSTN